MVANGTVTVSLSTDVRIGFFLSLFFAAMVLLTAFVVTCRFYTRYFISRSLGVDDWMTLVAFVGWLFLPNFESLISETRVLTLGAACAMGVMVTTGFGRHRHTLNADQTLLYMKV